MLSGQVVVDEIPTLLVILPVLLGLTALLHHLDLLGEVQPQGRGVLG